MDIPIVVRWKKYFNYYHLDNISLKRVEEIISRNPRIIQISGNRNPTYARDEFCITLIDFGNEMFQIGIRDDSEPKKIKCSKAEWLQNTILNINSNKYQLRKFGEDDFRIDEVDDLTTENNPHDNFGCDYGGLIELVI